jgi:hypothetical protein
MFSRLVLGYTPIYRVPFVRFNGDGEAERRRMVSQFLKRRGVVMLAVVIGVIGSSCGLTDSEPEFVTFTATINYMNAATYTVDQSASGGTSTCVPGVSKDGAIDHGTIVVTGFSIWSSSPTARYPLPGGSFVDGICVVKVDFPVLDSVFQDVQVGCASWNGNGRGTSDDGWDAGTLEYVGCLDRIATPEDWPDELLAASTQLRVDARAALSSVGFPSDLIEASPAAQPHPVTLKTCASGGVQDHDRDAFRFEERDIDQLAEHWKQAGYTMTATAFNPDGPNNQRRLRAAKDGIGTILVSWRTIGPNGEPFVIETFSPCFIRSFAPPT